MLGIPESTGAARDCGERWLNEVAPNGPTIEETVFSLCRIVCGLTGRCPLAQHTAEGFCVDGWHACPHDPRQPQARDYVEQLASRAASAAAPPKAKAPASGK